MSTLATALAVEEFADPSQLASARQVTATAVRLARDRGVRDIVLDADSANARYLGLGFVANHEALEIRFTS